MLLITATIATIYSLSLSGAPMIVAQQSSNTSSSSGNGSNTTTMTNLQILNFTATPLFTEHYNIINTTPINQTLTNQTSFISNVTFMLPSGNVSTSGSGIFLVRNTNGFLREGGQALLKTSDGKENVTLVFSEIRQANATTGIGVAYIQTNSTAQLAALNNMMGIFTDQVGPQTGTATFWRWMKK